MNHTMPENRRKTERLEKRSTIEHREFVLFANKPELVEDRLEDISVEGISFTTPNSYALSALVEVRLSLWGWELHKSDFYHGDPTRSLEPLVALVKVVSARQLSDGNLKIGAVFESIDEWHRVALGRWLDRQAAA